MKNSVRRVNSAFIVAGSALVLSVASLAAALHAVASAPNACPIGSIVKCLPSPGARATAGFIGQPLAWVGLGLLLVAVISLIIGLVHRTPSVPPA